MFTVPVPTRHHRNVLLSRRAGNGQIEFPVFAFHRAGMARQHIQLEFPPFASSSFAWAAASRAIGTRGPEQDT